MAEEEEQQPEQEKKRGPRMRLEVEANENGTRLDRYLKRRFRKMPHGLVHKLTRKRDVTVNRKRVRPDTRLEANSTIEVWADLEKFAISDEERIATMQSPRRMGAYDRFFRLVYEDEHLIAINKPTGWVVHPSKQHRQGDTLLDLLSMHIPEAFLPGSSFKPAFVHRLDRGTTGLIIAAKTRAAANGMENALRERRTEKHYLALVAGHLKSDEGEIRFAIEKHADDSGPNRYVADQDSKASSGSSKEACSKYRVEERLDRSTLVDVEIITGRTHQIRAHFAALGHPIVGDGDYGDKALNRRVRDDSGLERLFLHSSEFYFAHPVSGEAMRLTAPLPQDLLRTLSDLRNS